jgi:hypothetical protein
MLGGQVPRVPQEGHQQRQLWWHMIQWHVMVRLFLRCKIRRRLFHRTTPATRVLVVLSFSSFSLFPRAPRAPRAPRVPRVPLVLLVLLLPLCLLFSPPAPPSDVHGSGAPIGVLLHHGGLLRVGSPRIDVLPLHRGTL